ncbi:hypothetical protein M5K25_001744 [Dendrobium thyrsiflorum]|uniref:Uncharacterized protein n=1 Tax=Dendrobium thyrsiflorum TaxID=117978 RepID=A0ABD0W298_DENTH
MSDCHSAPNCRADTVAAMDLRQDFGVGRRLQELRELELTTVGYSRIGVMGAGTYNWWVCEELELARGWSFSEMLFFQSFGDRIRGPDVAEVLINKKIFHILQGVREEEADNLNADITVIDNTKIRTPPPTPHQILSTKPKGLTIYTFHSPLKVIHILPIKTPLKLKV